MKNVIFADDAVFYAESINFHELVETLKDSFQHCLIGLTPINYVIAHESKTQLMFFTTQIHPLLPDIRFNQNTLIIQIIQITYY